MIVSDGMYKIMLLAAKVKIKNGETKESVLSEYSRKLDSEQIEKMREELGSMNL